MFRSPSENCVAVFLHDRGPHFHIASGHSRDVSPAAAGERQRRLGRPHRDQRGRQVWHMADRCQVGVMVLGRHLNDPATDGRPKLASPIDEGRIRPSHAVSKSSVCHRIILRWRIEPRTFRCPRSGARERTEPCRPGIRFIASRTIRALVLPTSVSKDCWPRVISAISQTQS